MKFNFKTESSKIPKNASKIPKNVDLIKLADEIKRGMTMRVLRDLDELEKVRSR